MNNSNYEATNPTPKKQKKRLLEKGPVLARSQRVGGRGRKGGEMAETKGLPRFPIVQTNWAEQEGEKRNVKPIREKKGESGNWSGAESKRESLPALFYDGSLRRKERGEVRPMIHAWAMNEGREEFRSQKEGTGN